MGLIDKADIISEIERRIKELEPFKTEDNFRAHGAIAGYYQILSFIRSLEVKEAVDGFVTGNIRNQECEPYEIYAESNELPLNGNLKIGDKVKMVIFKED